MLEEFLFISSMGILEEDLILAYGCFESGFKVIPLYCNTHPYCARFVASLARAVSVCKSRAQ